MPNTQFTRNYTDRSNESGFQFEFHCDKCGNGHRSAFVTNKVGMATSILKAAGSIFGGTLRSASWGADHVKDALRGGAWDDAFQEAVTELKGKFKQCTRCGKWVCPDICWNAKRSLCEDCAPDLQEEAAHIQSKVAVEQAWDKARGVNQVESLDMKAHRGAACPHCNAKVESGKFCPECGKPLASKLFCTGCGAEVTATAKFCGDCGTPRK